MVQVTLVEDEVFPFQVHWPDAEQLLVWADRILTTTSLGEVFGTNSLASVCGSVYSITMPRVVIDTNVIVSALRSRRGPSFRLLTQIGTGRFEIALSVPLVLEYEDAALRATSVPVEALYKILGFLCTIAHRQKIFYLWRPHLPDPKDEMVLELAVASRASFIVTYNLRDFRGTERFGIRVVNPESFLDALED